MDAMREPATWRARRIHRPVYRDVPVPLYLLPEEPDRRGCQ